jgi:hypothetical protein
LSIAGQSAKLTEEQYVTFASLPPGSEEAALFMSKMVLVDGMQATHDTLLQAFRTFSRPLLLFHDLPITGHHPILLDTPSIKPDVSFATFFYRPWKR